MIETRPILSGVRVLDFGRYVAGPYCATLLGYLGAEVIRIEKIGGSEDRYIAPICEGGEGGVFFQTACNKRSLTLDPGSPAGREIMQRLLRTADIVVANLPPSGLTALGLDWPSLSALRPEIILVTQTAFGDQGPRAAQGGFDGVGQALSGAMYITGTPGSPAKAAAPYVDYSTAVLSAFGALAALLERQRTGRGQHVQAALQATALSVFGSHLIEQAVAKPDRVGTGNRVQTSAPSDVFATRDGHVLTHVVGDGLFRRWARLMGDAERWTGDPRFATDDGRGKHSAARHGERPRSTCRCGSARRPGTHAPASARRCTGRRDGVVQAGGGLSGVAAPRARARSAAAFLGQPRRHHPPPAAARRAHRRSAEGARLRRGRDRRTAPSRGDLSAQRQRSTR
jgi:crotonobetainyl-CoA:carnitine CoA-transferase CaiB-like acyl-CoA transferase